MNRLQIATHLMAGGRFIPEQAMDTAEQLLTLEKERKRAYMRNADKLPEIEKAIEQGLVWDADQSLWKWKQVTVVLNECGIQTPDKKATSCAGAYIRIKNNNLHRRSNGKNLLLVPPTS